MAGFFWDSPGLDHCQGWKFDSGELWGYIASGLILITNEIPLVEFLLEIGSSYCALTIFEWIIVRTWESTCLSIKEFLFLYRNAKWIWNCLNSSSERWKFCPEKNNSLRTHRLIIFVNYGDNLHSPSSKLTLELTYVDERDLILIKFKIYCQKNVSNSYSYNFIYYRYFIRFIQTFPFYFKKHALRNKDRRNLYLDRSRWTGEIFFFSTWPRINAIFHASVSVNKKMEIGRVLISTLLVNPCIFWHSI